MCNPESEATMQKLEPSKALHGRALVESGLGAAGRLRPDGGS